MRNKVGSIERPSSTSGGGEPSPSTRGLNHALMVKIGSIMLFKGEEVPEGLGIEKACRVRLRPHPAASSLRLAAPGPVPHASQV